MEDGSRCPMVENYEAASRNPIIQYLENCHGRLLVLYLVNQTFDMWRMGPDVQLLKIMKLVPAIQSSCIWRIAMVVYWSYILRIRKSICGGWLQSSGG